MPIARIQMPDGRVARIKVPEGTTPEQAVTYAQDVQAQPSVTDTAANAGGIAPSGATERFLRAAKNGFMENVTGLKQRLGLVTPEQVDASRQLAAPLLNTTAGKIGNFVGGAAPWMAASALVPGGSLAGTIASQGALGGIQGALQPTGTSPNDTVATNMLGGAAGGALTGAGGYGLARFATPFPGVPADRLALAKRAQAAGIQPRPSQVTNSPLLRTLESFSGKASAIDEANTQAINQLAAHAIGQPGERAITPDVLHAAYQGIDNRIAQLANGSVLNTQLPAYKSAVKSIIDDYNQLTPAAQKVVPGAEGWIRDLVRWYQLGSVPGETYQMNRSVASALARNSRGTEQHFYSNIVDAMDAAAPRQAEWAAVRNDYRNLLQLDKPNVIDAYGNVNGRALWTGAKAQKGNSQMADIAAYSKAFPTPTNTQSQASSSSKLFQALGKSAIGGATGVGVGSYLYGAKDPTELAHAAVLGGGLGILGPAMLKQLMTNPMVGNYLSRGLIGGTNLAPMLSPFAAAGARSGIDPNAQYPTMQPQP